MPNDILIPIVVFFILLCFIVYYIVTIKIAHSKNVADFFDSTKTIYMKIGIRGNILESNKTFSELTGFSAREIQRKNIELFIDKRANLSIFGYTADTTKNYPLSFEGNLLAKTNQRIAVDFTIARKGDAIPEEFVVTAFVAKDRTELKQKQHESERKYRKIFEQCALGLFRLSSEGEIVLANDAFIKILGYDSSEELLLTNFSVINARQQSLIEELIWILRKEKTIKGYEVKLKRKNGTPIYVIIDALELKDPISNDYYYDCSIFDISSIKDFVNETLMLKEKFEYFYRMSPIATAVLDGEGIVLGINDSFEKLFQYQRDELLGNSIQKVMHFDSKFSEDSTFWQQILENVSIEIEILQKKKDGTDLDLLIFTIPIIQSGKNEGTYLLCLDEGARKKAEREMRIAKERAIEMNSLKSNFLANMSHELRTPMNGILGFASLLLEEEELAEESKSMIDRIYSSGVRLMETLNLILDLSRIEANKNEINFGEVDFAWIIYEEAQQFLSEASKKGLDLQIDKYTGPIYVQLDESMFRKIIRHLVSNAVKFTQKGVISITSTSEHFRGKDWAIVTVKDTGIGIAEESQKVIFEEFRQVSEGMGRSFEGTGLGLTITKKFVELMRGKIFLSSKVAQGSTFEVRFPVAIPTQTSKIVVDELGFAQIIDEYIGEQPEEKSIPHILLVEDEDVNRDLILHYLRGICIIDCINNGIESIEKAKTNTYDGFLMDINLGTGLNGIDVARELRKLPEYFQTPIIAVTAFAMEDDRTKCLEAGCSDYIAKPFTRLALTNIVKKSLRLV